MESLKLFLCKMSVSLFIKMNTIKSKISSLFQIKRHLRYPQIWEGWCVVHKGLKLSHSKKRRYSTCLVLKLLTNPSTYLCFSKCRPALVFPCPPGLSGLATFHSLPSTLTTALKLYCQEPWVAPNCQPQQPSNQSEGSGVRDPQWGGECLYDQVHRAEQKSS